MDLIQDAVRRFGITPETVTRLRLKDGVGVYRVTRGQTVCVLKTFEKQDDRREIENYGILQTLGVPTLRLLASSDSALLLEDVEQSATLRLGREEDLRDPAVARRLAQWYRLLHGKGKAYVAAHGSGMYDETDAITPENMAFAALKTGTETSPAWALLQKNFDVFAQKAAAVERTLAYNDFYYTNLIVAKDASAAFMFDYNLLGKGYAYADIRNVTWALGKDANETFLEGYGPVNPAEALFDAAATTLTTLHFACQRDVFPAWANESLMQVRNGELERAILRLLAE